MSKNLTKAWTFLLRYEWAPVIKLLGRFNGENGKEIKQKSCIKPTFKIFNVSGSNKPENLFKATNHLRPSSSIWLIIKAKYYQKRFM